MRKAIVLFGWTALAACGNDVRETKIADIDFSDGAAIQRVAQKLEPSEREAFGIYVINRAMLGSPLAGGEIVRSDGTAPVTVREAIELAKMRKEKNDERGKLMNERNALVTRLNSLMGDNGLAEKDRPEWDRLKSEIAEYDQKLEQFK